jgi:hypothetical protein
MKPASRMVGPLERSTLRHGPKTAENRAPVLARVARNRVLAKHGVSRASKWRALEELRRAGLITVEERSGKAPLVKVRWTECSSGCP